MWYNSESKNKPELIDSTSSQKYVYVRKNITEIQREDETLYQYDEAKIPKDVYDIFRQQTESDSRLDEIEETIAEIIGGGFA